MPNGINDSGTTDNNPGYAGEEAPHAVGAVGDDAKVEGLSSTSNATAISTHADVIEKDTYSSTTKKLALQKATESNHHEVSDARDAHSKFREFDPIRQHSPFCPWIAPIDGKSTYGWKLTLSALVQ
ncbi:uncharacterized protein LOC120251948 [Dioscorea cayenensis subsp. rotundata]|uniref:Uncharacterized protein LOC120251948 n=1 Tax=Dioscorea cayennensis subsp. rotundata TaxID=55577 RepID=A0AB40APD0_DIOCR|nr:uncharacterized protein LOC120251948 [Dioscorea cayenensis subsp. rotundata]